MGEMADYYTHDLYGPFRERSTKKKDHWRTRGGHYIHFKDLSDQHLTNILRMLSRSGEKASGYYQFEQLKEIARGRGISEEGDKNDIRQEKSV